MSAIAPVVRHMLVCEAYRVDTSDPLKVDLLGVRHTLESSGDPPFPYAAPDFLVVIRTTGARGIGRCRIEVRHGASQATVYKSKDRGIKFTSHPLAIADLRMRVIGCIFPRSGLYMVQFRFEDRLIAQEPLLVS